MGCVKDIASNPIVKIGTDIALAATGNAEFIPIANAAETKAGGGSWKDAAISGGEAFLGQEVIGAAANAFPETAGSIGIDSSGNSLSDAIGTSSGAGSFAGPGTIGGSFNNAIGALGNEFGFTSGGTAAPVGGADASGGTVSSGGQPLSGTNPVSTSVTPSSGAPVSASQSIDLSAAQPTAALGENITGSSTSASPGLGTVGGEVPLTGASAESAIGAAGKDSIGASSDVFSQAFGGAPQLSANLPSTDFSGASTGGGSSGGFKDWLPSKSDVGSFAMKSALPVAGLAYDAIKGPAQLPSQSKALDAGGAATSPLLGLETSAANEATTGQLTQPEQAQITQYIQGAQNQLLQQLANAGVQNPQSDSRYIAGMQDIQQKAMALQQQFIQQAIQTAVSAGGAASSNIANVANQQIALDKDFQDSLSAAFAGLGGGVVSRPAA